MKIIEQDGDEKKRFTYNSHSYYELLIWYILYCLKEMLVLAKKK